MWPSRAKYSSRRREAIAIAAAQRRKDEERFTGSVARAAPFGSGAGGDFVGTCKSTVFISLVVAALALVALLGLRTSLGDIEISLKSSTLESSILPLVSVFLSPSPCPSPGGGDFLELSVMQDSWEQYLEPFTPIADSFLITSMGGSHLVDTCAVTGHWDDPLASFFILQTPDPNDWANFTLPSSSSWVDEGSFWLGLPLDVLMSFDDGGWRYCFRISHLFVSEDNWGTRPGTRFRSRRARLRYFKKWKKRYAIYEARMRRVLCFFLPMLQGACFVAGAAFSLSKPSVRSSGRIFACFAFRLGSTAFTASLYFQLTYVLLSSIRRAMHCGKFVFSSLITQFGRKAADCGCYRIAARILRFGQFWLALSMVLAFIINERPKDDKTTSSLEGVANVLDRPVNVLVRVSGKPLVPMKAQSVFTIAWSISASLNCLPSELCVVHNGTYLSFGRTLRSYNIQNNAILEVVLRLKGGGAIDYENKENLATFKKRFVSLSAASNVWFPLTRDKRFYERVPGAPTLWGHMGLSYEDFFGLIDANPSMW